VENHGEGKGTKRACRRIATSGWRIRGKIGEGKEGVLAVFIVATEKGKLKKGLSYL